MRYFLLPPPPQLIDETIEYIEFLDSDDYLESDCIEVSIRYTQQYQLDLVCTGINQVSSEYKKIFSDHGLFDDLKKNQIYEGKNIIREIKKNYFHAVCNILIDFNYLRNIKLYFINNIIYEDHHFGSILFLKAKRVMILDNYFYNQVNSINSTTRPKEITQSRILLNFQSWKMTIEKLEQDVQSQEDRKIIKKHIQNFYFPMMCKSYLELDSSFQQKIRNEIKKYEKYRSLKTSLMLNFPKIYSYLKKIKRYI